MKNAWWMAGVAVVALAAPAVAQESDRERIDRLEREVDALKRAQAEAASGTAYAKRSDNGAALAAEGPKKSENPETRLEWGWDDGFFVKGWAGDFPFTIRPRARAQIDYRAFEPPASINDQFVLRRTRVGFDGTFGDFAYQLEVDPPRSPMQLGDFWFQWQAYDPARVRMGHYKTPWSLEDGMTSDLYLDTVERAMIIGSGASLAPDFRPGAEVWGELGKGAFKYWLNAQNGPDSNTVVSDEALFCARTELNFAGIGLGGAGIWDRQGAIGASSISGRTPGQFQWFAPVLIHGLSQRYEADLNYYNGPLWFAGEYAWAKQERDSLLAGGGDAAALIAQGFYATVGFKVWGPASDTHRPHVPTFRDWTWFSWDNTRVKNGRNVGLELLWKVEWMQCYGEGGSIAANPSLAGNAANIAGNGCKASTLGLNFDPIENVRIMIDWVHLNFDHADETRAERHNRNDADEFLIRWQLEF